MMKGDGRGRVMGDRIDRVVVVVAVDDDDDISRINITIYNRKSYRKYA